LYPAAVLSASANSKAAGEFLEYLKTAAAADIFKAVGFVIPQ
jgi:ABC-type molybdate transport system substrate-binding protein